MTEDGFKTDYPIKHVIWYLVALLLVVLLCGISFSLGKQYVDMEELTDGYEAFLSEQPWKKTIVDSTWYDDLGGFCEARTVYLLEWQVIVIDTIAVEVAVKRRFK